MRQPSRFGRLPHFFDIVAKFLRKKSVIIFVYVPKMCKFAKIWFQKMAKNHIFGT